MVSERADTGDESRQDPDDPQARADAAIRAIAGGADPAAEAFELSNQFTDAATARWSAAWKRRFRRDPRG